ncbi:MAG: hypothetical protein ACJ8GN_25555 [Longimicrobiaceae bacterium]
MYRLMPFTRRALAAASLALAVAAGSLTAQAASPVGCTAGESTLRVGDPRLASFTPFPADTVDMVMERGGTVRNGLFTQQTVRSRREGRDAWLTVQSSQTPIGPSLDSVWVDARTWAPIRHFSTFPGGRVDVTYAGGRVTGTLVRGDTTTAVDQAVDPGIFEMTVSGDVVGSVPLCPGAVVHVTSFDPAVGMRESEYRMLGTESVEIGGRQYTGFAVATTVNERTVKLYLDPANRHLFAWRAEGQGVTLRGTSRFLPGRN